MCRDYVALGNRAKRDGQPRGPLLEDQRGSLKLHGHPVWHMPVHMGRKVQGVPCTPLQLLRIPDLTGEAARFNTKVPGKETSYFPA